jgi:DNA polymerase III delta subunit
MAKQPLTPCAVYFGVEDFLLDRAVQKVRSLPGRMVVELDGDEATVDTIISECMTHTLDGSDLTVIVENAHKVKASKALKTYIEKLDKTDTSSVLIAVCRSEKLPEAWAVVQGIYPAKSYEKLKTWDNDNQVVEWIEAEAKFQKVKLDKGVPDMLYKFVGHDLYALAGEISKLGHLVGSGNTVTAKHVQAVVVPMAFTTSRDVCEAIGRRDADGALNMLSKIYAYSDQDQTLAVSGALQKHIEKMVICRQMLDVGSHEDEMAAALGVKPYRLKNHWLPMVKRHNLASLVRAMGKLARLDENVKGPSPSKRTLLELAVIAIS